MGGGGCIWVVVTPQNATFLAGELQKVDKQQYISLESPFHELFKIQLSNTLELFVKLYPLAILKQFQSFLVVMMRAKEYKSYSDKVLPIPLRCLEVVFLRSL